MKKLLSIIKKAKKIALFSHISPDPDTVGSTMGLYFALLKLKKDVSIFCDDDNLEKFAFIEADKIYNKKAFKANNFDCLIAVDIATLDRVGEMFEKQFAAHSNSVKIDHHKIGDDYAKFNFMLPYSACSIFVYEIITKLKIKIDEKIATLLYFGICGDTGGFKFNNTDALTFEICAKLMRAGADIRYLHSEFFDKKTLEALKLTSSAILSSKVNKELNYVLMIIKQSDFEKFGASEKEYVGNVPNLLLNCGFDLACIIKEKSDGIRVSLRSKIHIDCSLLAAKFGGGGHRNASGISFGEGCDVKKVEKDLEKEIQNYLRETKGEN